MRLTRGVPSEGLSIRVTDTAPLAGATHCRVERTGEIIAIERLTPHTLFASERAVDSGAAGNLFPGDELEAIVAPTTITAI